VNNIYDENINFSLHNSYIIISELATGTTPVQHRCRQEGYTQQKRWKQRLVGTPASRLP